MQVLYKSQDIRREIQRIFKRRGQRRVAIVAYVGGGAPAHLPHPKGLDIYCWPQAGGTSVAALQKSGANVFFADRVHMKVYWSEHDGAVIGSANLSDNALGAGDLREAGVALPSDQVDIDRLIAIIGAEPVSPESLKLLRKRESAWNRDQGARGKVTIPTFVEWYDGKGGARWKWAYWEQAGGEISRSAKRAIREIDPSYAPQNGANCRRGELQEEDWVLSCRLTPKGDLIAPEWLYVERVVFVEKDDRGAYDPEYPCQAVQARELRHCPPPPFRISSDFRKALREVSRREGREKTTLQVDGGPPTPAFLKILRAAC